MRFYIVKILDSQSRGRMDRVLKEALKAAGDDCAGFEPVMVESAEEFCSLCSMGMMRNCRILFAVELGKSGINLEAYKIISYLNATYNSDIMSGSAGGVIIDGDGALFTKDMGRRMVFAANMAGCHFPGKPLTEATGKLANFKIVSGLWDMELEEAYVKSCGLLIKKIWSFKPYSGENPYILAIHAGSHKTSNSLCLWRMIAENLKGRAEIEEISIRNGEVRDCRGCKYEDCLHFGENSNCFYGGVMVEKVYPAIIKCDILVLICPNYNDAISANIMAFINRLTAVFRANDFSRKRIYAIVVSGYSGGDIVAEQIISAINMNKNFVLPGRFAFMETANNPGDIMKIKDIEKRAAQFADRMLKKL